MCGTKPGAISYCTGPMRRINLSSCIMGELLKCGLCSCSESRADILVFLNGQARVIAVLWHDHCTVPLRGCSFSGVQLY